ncbi:MAG TPA: hypothetical protein VHB21_08480, partial [Minicystis sp.]|nr:hypothetical protein [Minicystis sp.]
MRRAAGAVAAAAFALLVAGAACFRPPRPGDPCSDAELSCFDAATALECLGGVRVGVHCGGPRGCEAGAASLWCDQSDANENDLCVAPRMKKFGDGACSLDKKSMLACVNGRFVERARCRGPLGCGHVGQHVSCDASVAEPGDGCLGEGNAACSVDGARALRCAGGRFAVAAACDGEDRCRIEENHVRCDERRGRPGAPCRATSACSVDGASLL